MIIKPMFLIGIDGLALGNNQVKEVSLYSSIDQTLPELTFKIEDNQGTILSQLKTYIGAKVSVAIGNLDYNSDKNKVIDNQQYKIVFSSFAITQIYDGTEFGGEGLGGFVQVWCKPSWYLYGTYQGHAYAPMKLSELIKKVCSDANELAELTIEDDNFSTSSDPGNVPRYKTGESDLDFIEQKLLPYTNIDDSNVFFYVDWFGKPHLTSFSKLITQSEKFIATPPVTDSDTINSKLKDLTESKTLYETGSWSDITVNLGNANFDKVFGELKQKLIFENNSTGKVYIANSQPSAKMGKDKDKNFNSKVPISALRMEMIDATSCKIIRNKPLSDALSLARNSDISLIDFMTVELKFQQIIDVVQPGDTIFLLPPFRKVEGDDVTDEDKKRVNHWIAGKWLVLAMKYTQMDSNPMNSITQMTVCRPTLSFNSDTTTLDNSSYFYTIG